MKNFNEEARDSLLYREAKKRVKLKKDFKAHRNSYIIVMVFLLIINIWTSPGYLWVKWPALGWGLGLVFHWIDVMGKLNNTGKIEKEIDREMEILKRKMGYDELHDDSNTKFYNENFNNYKQDYNRNNNAEYSQRYTENSTDAANSNDYPQKRK